MLKSNFQREGIGRSCRKFADCTKSPLIVRGSGSLAEALLVVGGSAGTQIHTRFHFEAEHG